MKNSKKVSRRVVITSLSSLMSIGAIASVAGTFAWYQFSTRATASIVGANVAETGVLQISKDQVNWGRDLITADLVGSEVKLTPVTFGALNADGSLPADAYKRPDASDNAYATNPGSYAEVYEVATEDVDYINYTIYLRAMEVDDVAGGLKQVARDVYLTDIVLEDGSHTIEKGLRAHIAIDQDADGNDDRFILLSKDGVQDLQLSGVLDLDGDGKADVKGGYEWNTGRENMVIYGNEGEVQNADAINDWKANRESDGSILAANNDGKLLLQTLEDNDVKVTVTLWVEGWDMEVGKTDVAMTQLKYREVKVEDVSAYYYLDGDDYKKASGKAEDAKTYLELNPVLSAVADGEEVPEKHYKLDGANYVLAAGEISDGVTEYFRLRPLEAHVVKPADVTAKLANLYEKTLANDYIKTTDAAAVSNKTYYSLDNDDVVYTSKDYAATNSGSSPVDEFLFKDGANNYIKPSLYNVAGREYYEIAATEYNPQLTDMDDGFIAGEKMEALNCYYVDSGDYVKETNANTNGRDYFRILPRVANGDIELSELEDNSFLLDGLFVDNGSGVYEACDPAAYNVKGTDYYENNAGEIAHLNDLPSGRIADISACYSGTLYIHSSNTYTPATGAYDAGVDYIVLDSINSYNPHLTGVLDGLPNGTVTQAKLEEKGLYYTAGTIGSDIYYEINSSSVRTYKYYTLVVTDFDDYDGENSGTGLITGYYCLDGDNNYVSSNIQRAWNIKGTEYYYISDFGTVEAPMWSGENTDGKQFHFGLTFDVGKAAFNNN